MKVGLVLQVRGLNQNEISSLLLKSLRVSLLSWVKCKVKWQVHLVLVVAVLVVALSSCHQGSPLQGDDRHVSWSLVMHDNVHTHVTYATGSNLVGLKRIVQYSNIRSFNTIIRRLFYYSNNCHAHHLAHVCVHESI